MTALYTVLAIIIIGGILFGAYLIGFDDGIKAEQMRRRLYIESRTVTLDDDKHHALTHADMVQMEEEVKNEQRKDNEI